MTEQPLTIVYRNWKGETATRRILPRSVRWGESAWHPGPQWLLEAFDVGKGADRTFAFTGILEVRYD